MKYAFGEEDATRCIENTVLATLDKGCHASDLMSPGKTLVGCVRMRETCATSTISYLDNGFVYTGLSYGDPQLIKLHLQPDARSSYAEVLQRFVNLDPTVDSCVVDLER